MSADTDCELLELAAKAAGIAILRSRLDDPLWRDMLLVERNPLHEGVAQSWNPLTDDGDALRLAVDLCLRIYPFASTMSGYACSAVAGGDNTRLGEAVASGDVRADTRRAIVRAAAEIGRAMP